MEFLVKIIELVQADKWYNLSQNMEIAKGKYQTPGSFKEVRKDVVREFKYRKPDRNGKDVHS